MTKQIKFIPAAEAVKVIKTGDHIHLSSVASAPQCLINAMCDRGRNKEFEHVHVHHLHPLPTRLRSSKAFSSSTRFS
jgi:acyl-CoA hydrolase